MSESLWNKGFKAVDVETPRDIIQKQCIILNKMTEGKIIGRIVEYDKRINRGITLSIKIDPPHHFVNDDVFVFDFFITSRATPKYKFRICLIEFGISQYPVLIALDSDIASEIDIDEQFCIESEGEFLECISRILNSEKLYKVITSLLAFNV